MLDISTLEELFEDHTFIAGYLRLFLHDIKVQLSALQDFAMRQDCENAAITAHTIKSQLKYVGAERAAGHAQSLEMLFEKCRSEEWQDWQSTYDALFSDVESTLIEIKSWLETFDKIRI